MKRQYLLELVDYISQSKHWFVEETMPPILEMIGSNLFRSLPPPIYPDFDPEEDEPNFDPAWFVLCAPFPSLAPPHAPNTSTSAGHIYNSSTSSSIDL